MQRFIEHHQQIKGNNNDQYEDDEVDSKANDNTKGAGKSSLKQGTKNGKKESTKGVKINVDNMDDDMPEDKSEMLRRKLDWRRIMKEAEANQITSKEAKLMNKLFNDVKKQNNGLGMTLVQTREKLKPFVDDGVVHKDRKKESKPANDEGLN